jgi:hypothetical protein
LNRKLKIAIVAAGVFIAPVLLSPLPAVCLEQELLMTGNGGFLARKRFRKNLRNHFLPLKTAGFIIIPE